VRRADLGCAWTCEEGRLGMCVDLEGGRTGLGRCAELWGGGVDLGGGEYTVAN
jgi:hypothetical protein